MGGNVLLHCSLEGVKVHNVLPISFKFETQNNLRKQLRLRFHKAVYKNKLKVGKFHGYRLSSFSAESCKLKSCIVHVIFFLCFNHYFSHLQLHLFFKKKSLFNEYEQRTSLICSAFLFV